MAEGRLPTGLLVEACLTPLNGCGIFYTIPQKGNHSSGIILLKLNSLKGQVRLLIQQRNFLDDTLEWVNALEEETVEESAADEYIKRSISRDPDLWVIEIEDEAMANPFEE